MCGETLIRKPEELLLLVCFLRRRFLFVFVARSSMVKIMHSEVSLPVYLRCEADWWVGHLLGAPLGRWVGDGDNLIRGNLQGVDPVIHTAATSHLSCCFQPVYSQIWEKKWDPDWGRGVFFRLSQIPSVWEHTGNETTVCSLKSWYKGHQTSEDGLCCLLHNTYLYQVYWSRASFFK